MSIKFNQPKNAARLQRGYSLIELSISMAILSVIIVGSLLGVQRILANNRTNNVLQFIPRLNATLISGTLGGTGSVIITTTLANQLGAFEAGVVSGSGATLVAKNEYGGKYALISNSEVVGNTPAKAGYFVYVTSVPANVCPILANGLSTMTDGMWIGTETQLATPAPNATAAQATPTAGGVETPGSTLDIAKVGAQCSASTTNTLVGFVPLT